METIKKTFCGLFALFLCCLFAYAVEDNTSDVAIQPGIPQYFDNGIFIDLDVNFNDPNLYHEQVLISYHIVDANGKMLLFENQKLDLTLDSDGVDKVRFYIDCQSIQNQIGPIDEAFLQFDLGDYRDMFWYSLNETINLHTETVYVDMDRFENTFWVNWETVLAATLCIFLLTAFLLKWKKLTRQDRKAAFLQSLGPVLLGSFSFALFFPGMLVFGNTDDLMVSWTQILPICFVVFSLSTVIFFVLFFVLPKQFREFCCAILVGISVAAYLQFSFLNANFGELNGVPIDWSAFRSQGYISVGVWFVCVLVPIALTLRKKVQTQRVLRFTALAIVVFQTLILSMTGITVKPPASDFILTYDNAFSVSQNQNTIVFVLDHWDGALFRNWLQENPEQIAGLDGFTFFDNAVSGGAPTFLGITALLTGSPYKADKPLADYIDETYAHSELFHSFEDSDVDARILTFSSLISNEVALKLDNARQNTLVISSKLGYAQILYRFAFFTCMPQPLKQNFWLYTGEFSHYLKKADFLLDEDAEAYIPSNSQSDVNFYMQLQKVGLSTIDKNVFRFYHLFATHYPWYMNENGEISLETTSYEQQMEGTLKIVRDYLQKLKNLGLYESSTIILTGDHGGMNLKATQANLNQNPAVCIKPAGESEGFRISHAPITFEELNATIGVGIGGSSSQFGRTVFDVPEDEERVRWHTVYKSVNDMVYPNEDHGSGSYDCYTFRVDGAADDMCYISWVENWGG